MRHAKPGRRLGRVSGRTLLADRLRDELLEEITSSQLQPGTKLPTEGQLAKRFNVSRATVRDAVGALIEAGYVTRRRGSGSYVAERRRMPHGLDSTLSYLAMIESAGVRAGMHVLEAAFEESSKDDSPSATQPRRHGPGGRAGTDGRRSTGDLLTRSHPRAPAPHRPRSAEPRPLAVCAAEVPRDMRQTTRRRRCAPSPAPAISRKCSVSGEGSLCCTSRRSTTTGTELRSCCPGNGTFPKPSMSGSTGRPTRAASTSTRSPPRQRRSSDHGRTAHQADD